jgi:UDP-N-acetylglucosamine 2-epimerase (non-hydrolysing)
MSAEKALRGDSMTVGIKTIIVAGARPNFMKVAPLMKRIAEQDRNSDRGWFDVRLVHTGQHYDQKMSNVFFQELGIPAPDINLGVGSGSQAVQTASVMTSFEPVCVSEKPDWVIVVGDVNSTVACTLVCAKMGIRVAHVEAGLRSFDRAMPEEINRIVTDSLADLLLTPSEDGNQNLRREGVAEERIKLVGNIMIDSLIENLPMSRQSSILNRLGLKSGQFAFVTLHRPSNVDGKESLTANMAEVERLAARVPVVFPIHPRTRKMLGEFGIMPSEGKGLQLIDPIGYHDSLCLTENARLLLTDSGGLQEEATYFRTPCLTLRPSTERPVTVTMGSNRLTNLDRLAADIEEFLGGPERRGVIPPLWDGRTARRTLDEIIGASRR